MEAKIDGLVTLLKSTQQPISENELAGFATDRGPSENAHSLLTPSSIDGLCPSIPSSQLGDQETPSAANPALDTNNLDLSVVANPNTPRSPEPRPLFSIRPSPEEAEILLNRFRQMTLYFPLMNLSASTSARNLLQDRPFLYHCIMAVSCQISSQQIAFEKEMMQYLGEQMLVKGTKSLDLLLGILTYAGWFVLSAASYLPRTIL